MGDRAQAPTSDAAGRFNCDTPISPCEVDVEPFTLDIFGDAQARKTDYVVDDPVRK